MCNRITLRLSLSRANRKLRKREEQSNVEPHSTWLTQSADAREKQLTHASHPLLALGKLPPENNNARSRRHTHSTPNSISPGNTRAISTPAVLQSRESTYFGAWRRKRNNERQKIEVQAVTKQRGNVEENLRFYVPDQLRSANTPNKLRLQILA